jgi:hypothetical protein
MPNLPKTRFPQVRACAFVWATLGILGKVSQDT